jgi:hypothetical protein
MGQFRAGAVELRAAEANGRYVAGETRRAVCTTGAGTGRTGDAFLLLLPARPSTDGRERSRLRTPAGRGGSTIAWLRETMLMKGSQRA